MTVRDVARGGTIALALLAACWSVLPAGVWFAGWDAAYFARTRALWRDGGLVTLLLGGAVLVLSRGRAAGALAQLARRVTVVPPRRFVAAAALAAAALALGAAWGLFAGNPRNVDGFAQLFQARIFLAGRLWLVPPAELEHFATLQMILGPDRWLAQYPPGQSLVLAAGLLLGAWWLLNPIIAALFVWTTWRVARWSVGDGAARLTLLLLVLSPFVLAMSGSEMSHLAAATLGMGAAAAALRAREAGNAAAATVAGTLLGLQTLFRPLDAVAAAVPVGLVLLAAPGARRALTWTTLGGIAGAFPTLLWNRLTTGQWSTFGYTVLWGPQHTLGFHDVPWGTPLTPLRAAGLLSVDLHQLNAYLLDWPLPILVAGAVGLAAAYRRLSARVAVPAAGAAALFGLLFFYWHRDVFYGPRLHFSAVPWVLMLAARGLTGLAAAAPPRFGGARAGGAMATLLAAAAVVGLVGLTPARLAAYRDTAPLFRLHPARAATAAGIRHAVVVVPDGWASRLIVRMWAAGVPVWRSSRLYAALDACALQEALDGAAAAPRDPARLLARLDSLAALGRPGARVAATLDPNLRLPPDSLLTPVCRAELARDSAGFLAYAPLLWLNRADLAGEVVWARDMGRLDALRARYPDRAFYRWAPAAPGEESTPRFIPLGAADVR